MLDAGSPRRDTQIDVVDSGTTTLTASTRSRIISTIAVVLGKNVLVAPDVFISDPRKIFGSHCWWQIRKCAAQTRGASTCHIEQTPQTEFSVGSAPIRTLVGEGVGRARGLEISGTGACRDTTTTSSSL